MRYLTAERNIIRVQHRPHPARCRYCQLFLGLISQAGICRLCWEQAGWVWNGRSFDEALAGGERLPVAA
jgi:hypothetical protein